MTITDVFGTVVFSGTVSTGYGKLMKYVFRRMSYCRCLFLEPMEW